MEWSKKNATAAVRGDMEIMLLDKTQQNAKDRNVRAAISALRDFIMGGLPIPPPDTEWVTMPTVTNTGFVFDVDGAGVANFPATQGQTFAATSYTVPAAGADLQYVFLIYANPDGTYGTVSGPQSQNPATPPYPADALYVSHAIVSETAGEIQDPPSYVTFPQVQALLSDYLHKNGAAFQTVSTGQGVMLESTGAFEADAITWGQYFDPYELTTHRERRNSSNALVSGFYGGRFKEKGWQGVGLFLGVMPTGVTQETEWEFSYDTLVSGNKTTYSGHFASDAKSGLFIVTHDGATTTTFEFSDAFYVNGQPFSGSAFTPIAENQVGTHPAFTNQHELNLYLLSNGTYTPSEPNQAPTANAGTDQTITLPTNSVTLAGSGTDSDGTISTYAWTKLSGGAATITTPTAASTTVTGLVEGVYVFRLTVTDNGSLTATDDVQITVNADPGPGEDTTPPSAPGAPTFANITTTSATANWTPATDNEAVAGYNLYIDGVKQN